MGHAANPESAEEEVPRRTKFFRDFQGVYTKSARTAVQKDHFYDLVNIMPIGPANAHTVPAPFITAFNSGADSIYWGQYVNIGGTNYQLLFGTSGKVYAYNIDANTSATIATTLSGAGSRATQWKNTVALIIDSTGLYSWNGSTFTQLSNSSNGVPQSGQDIAVAFGRVFVVNGRVLTYSAIDDYGVNYSSTVTAWLPSTGYTSGVSKVVDLASGNIYTCTGTGTSAATGTGPTGQGTGIVDGTCTWNFVSTAAWTTSNGSSFINLTDPLLRSNVSRLWSQNGYLYIIGNNSMFVIAYMYVPDGVSPPLPIYLILPVDPLVGTDQPGSMIGNSRDPQFATRYGVYDVAGVEANRISSDIDGTWQYLDFTKAISGAFCIINEIACSCFLVNQKNDPVIGSRNTLAVYFDQKWFFVVLQDPSGLFNAVYNNPVTLLISGIFNNQPTAFAMIGGATNQTLLRLFDNYTVSPPSSFKTALWDMDDPLSDKQVIRAGFEVSTITTPGGLTLNIDTPNDSVLVNAPTLVNGIPWINNSNAIVQWQNNALAIVQWFSGGYLLFSGSAPGAFKKYVGCSLSAPALTAGGWAAVYELDGVYLDYISRARW